MIKEDLTGRYIKVLNKDGTFCSDDKSVQIGDYLKINYYNLFAYSGTAERYGKIDIKQRIDEGRIELMPKDWTPSILITKFKIGDSVKNKCINTNIYDEDGKMYSSYNNPDTRVIKIYSKIVPGLFQLENDFNSWFQEIDWELSLNEAPFSSRYTIEQLKLTENNFVCKIENSQQFSKIRKFCTGMVRSFDPTCKYYLTSRSGCSAISNQYEIWRYPIIDFYQIVFEDEIKKELKEFPKEGICETNNEDFKNYLVSKFGRTKSSTDFKRATGMAWGMGTWYPVINIDKSAKEVYSFEDLRKFLPINKIDSWFCQVNEYSIEIAKTFLDKKINLDIGNYFGVTKDGRKSWCRSNPTNWFDYMISVDDLHKKLDSYPIDVTISIWLPKFKVGDRFRHNDDDRIMTITEIGKDSKKAYRIDNHTGFDDEHYISELVHIGRDPIVLPLVGLADKIRNPLYDDSIMAMDFALKSRLEPIFSNLYGFNAIHKQFETDHADAVRRALENMNATIASKRLSFSHSITFMPSLDSLLSNNDLRFPDEDNRLDNNLPRTKTITTELLDTDTNNYSL